METILKLYERKNLCFKSFFQICNDFLDEISKGNIEGLDVFQARREGLIGVLEQLESQVQIELEFFKKDSDSEKLMTNEVKEKINLLMNEKDGYLKQILDLDRQILLYINRLKDDTLQKLQSIQRGRKTIGAYRSPSEQIENAEGVKRVDQEV